MLVKLVNNESKQLLNKHLQSINLDGFSSVQLAHFGELNQDIINSFTVNIEEMMTSAGDRKPLIKRVFSILIEGLQNILIHGEQLDDEQMALLIVASNESAYRVILGNYTMRSDKDKLLVYLDRLNNMTDDQVKEYYLEVLNNGLISSKGGAGLGFITMRMKSKNALKFNFEDVSDGLMFFTISTDLLRKSE